MASTKEFINQIISLNDGITLRAMMGDYILYYYGKIVGGIYDNRLLVKVTRGSEILCKSEYQVPYAGAKPMLFVKDTSNKIYMQELFRVLYNELPEPKSKKSKY